MDLQRVYDRAPESVQNLMVTTSNWLSLRRRRSGAYSRWKQFFAENEFLARDGIVQLQQARLREFLTFAARNSHYHRERLRGADLSEMTVERLCELPQMSKEDLRANTAKIETLRRRDAYVGKTGGTTGAAIEVLYRWDDFQERTAMLDLFRERYVRIARPRIAWFSGKNLVPNPNRTRSYGRSDFLSRMRFYSTFDIRPATVSNYIEDLNRFAPQMLVGFPSAMLEIATFAEQSGLALDFHPEAIFPTAETLTDETRETLEAFYGCGVHDQYASSEGAPFITECPAGRLHQEMLTGVFEVLDEHGRKANEGELVVTAFGTRGTPLIRYRIGDRIRLAEGDCECGRKTLLVDRIEGRPTDFLQSSERGRVSFSNMSNVAKLVHGMRKFQVIQTRPDAVTILVSVDTHFGPEDEKQLVRNFRDRLGETFEIDLKRVDDIPREASGKYLMIKNLIDKSNSGSIEAVK